VIGGGVTAAGDALFIPMREKALGYAFPRLAAVCSIVPAGLGGNVGVVGPQNPKTPICLIKTIIKNKKLR
jgi:hypothetical protein